MTKRADHDLAFMLKYENVAWYDKGAVRILDRRIYPIKTEFVTCTSHTEVAQSIADMVTQSAGPYYAAAMGMALAAHEAKGEKDFFGYMEKAAYTLSHARPTTVARMEAITADCLAAAKKAAEEGKNVEEAIFDFAVGMMEFRYSRIAKTASHLVDHFPSKGTIMTQCFGDTVVGLFLREAKNRGYDLKIICPETRPYFQGARLTASVACDQGFDVTVITDNMPGFAMMKKGVDIFTSAADAICMDGTIINKVGTFQIALCAHHFGIPYFVTGAPDIRHASADDVKIEERDPLLAMDALGTRTTMEGVKGWYPAFDITPSNLVSGVVTDKGMFSAKDLASYFKDGEAGVYSTPTC